MGGLFRLNGGSFVKAQGLHWGFVRTLVKQTTQLTSSATAVLQSPTGHALPRLGPRGLLAVSLAGGQVPTGGPTNGGCPWWGGRTKARLHHPTHTPSEPSLATQLSNQDRE